MNHIKVKKYFFNFITIIVSSLLGLLIANFILIKISNQKNFPRSLAGSLPNLLLTFYPDTYKKDSLSDYVAILGDSYSQGGGEAYLNNEYNYSFGHHLFANDSKNYLNFGRAGFGSISAIANLIKINKLSNLPNLVPNLKKPKSIIFFFYEGNDLEDNIFEYNSFVKQKENLRDFVNRRIDEKIKLINVEKITNIFPLFPFLNKLYNHLDNLVDKIFKSKDLNEIKLLTIKTIKKLFGYTVIISNEKNDFFKHTNSLKEHENIKNIRPLQSAAADLSDKEILISLEIFFNSIQYVKTWSQINKIFIVYIPSPISSYLWNEPITYVARNPNTGAFNKEIKTTTNIKNNLKSIFIRSEISNFSKINNIKFIDITDFAVKAAVKNTLHGPLDWHHFNYNGYKSTSNYISRNLEKN